MRNIMFDRAYTTRTWDVVSEDRRRIIGQITWNSEYPSSYEWVVRAKDDSIIEEITGHAKTLKEAKQMVRVER